MQIRYRITLVYTLIVTVILVMLCYSVYFFSSQNRTKQFYERLESKAESTADLLWVYGMDADLVRKINKTSPSALDEKALYVYDKDLNLVFDYYDNPGDSSLV